MRCEHPAELGFVLHSSESLSRRHFNKLKQFISGIATAFGVDGAKSRAGLVLYSDKASVPIRLDQSKNLTEYIIALTNLRREAGRNRIDLALKAANQRLFTATSRDSASRVVVLLTLGKETKNGAGAISSKGIAGQMRARGIKIFVVAVGSNVDVPELQKIVDEPNRVIKAETFDDLDNEALVRRLCDESGK